MNILIITGIFPPDIGGPATYVPAVAASLNARGHDVRVITLSDTPETGFSAHPFPVVRIHRNIPRPVRMIKTIAAVIRFGRKADILYVNGLALESVAANFFIRKPLVQKVVGDLIWERSTAAGIITDRLETFQKKRYGFRVEFLKKLRAYWTAKSDLVITPSEYLKRIVQGWGVAGDNIKVIYNAVSPQADADTDGSCPFVDDHTIVSVGRLVPWKGFDALIDAVSEIEGAKLVIIGEGSMRAELENRIEKAGLKNRVWLTGALLQHEVGAVLKKTKVFVLNSTYEGFPHIVLEAMAAGAAVIATDAGGTGEIVQNGKNGLLIPAGCDSSLKQSVAQLLDNGHLRKALVEQGYKTAEMFSRENQLAETEGALRECLG